MRILLTILLLAAAAHASTPGTITYQGRLTDAGGQPMDTTVDLTFRIYGAPSGGGALWVETHSNVVITSGLFDLILGSIQPFGSVFNGSTRYLSIQVGTDTESDDRTQIVSVPYAMRATRSDSADVAVTSTSGGGWIDEGNVVRLETEYDSVAIGTSDPECPLDVRSGGFAVHGRSFGGPGHAGVYGHAEYNAYGVMGTSSSGRGVCGISTTGYGGYFYGPKSYVSGSLGIGTEDPTHKLTVNGFLGIQSGEDTKFHIGYLSGGLSFTETSVADYRLFIEAGGRVGIGTSSPQKKFHVAGSTQIDGVLTAGTFYSSNITDAVGIASAASGDAIALASSATPYLSRQITVPTTGYIVAFGCCYLSITHAGGDITSVRVGLSADPNSLDGGHRYGASISSSAEGGLHGHTAAFNRLFYCPGPGTYTYYMVAWYDGGAIAYIDNMELDLFFCRTVYSSKAPDPESDQEAGESLSEIMVEHDADGLIHVAGRSSGTEADMCVTKIDMLMSEIEALKERLQALEGQ